MSGAMREDAGTLALVAGVVTKLGDGVIIAMSSSPVEDLTVCDKITVKLKHWRGHDVPQVGDDVMLVNVMRYASGWRAEEASPSE